MIKPFNCFSFKRKPIFLFLITIVCIFCLDHIFVTDTSQALVKQSLTSQQLGQIINETEKSWEKDYEKYFDKDFTNYSNTEVQIAKQLSQLSQNGTKPAVMWAVPAEKQLHLLLITPGNKPIIKSIRGADRQTLFKTIDTFIPSTLRFLRQRFYCLFTSSKTTLSVAHCPHRTRSASREY